MKQYRTYFALIIAFILAAPSLIAGDFITAAEAKKMMKDPNVTFISAQKIANFKKGHIKGAIHIDHQDLYKGGDYKGVLHPVFKLNTILGTAGVSNTKTLVIYDDGKNKYNTRLYWIFKHLGVKNVKLLHKDMAVWGKIRIPYVSAPTKVTKTTFKSVVNKSILVSTAQVKSSIGSATTVIVDARTKAEFNGTSEKPKSPGHIKGAKNINWEDLTTSKGALKSKTELTATFKKQGVTANKKVILYCETSVRAGILFYVLTSELGYKNVAVYDGALTVWQKNPANPISK